MKIIRTNSKNKDFVELVEKLDTYLSIINGDSDGFFKQFNKLEDLNCVILIYNENQAIGCGAFKKYNDKTVEIKRMFVKKAKRRVGIASTILNELENWAKEIGYSKCILETAHIMKDAITFYKNKGYGKIPNYDQYKNVKSSICFEKLL